MHNTLVQTHKQIPPKLHNLSPKNIKSPFFFYFNGGTKLDFSHFNVQFSSSSCFPYRNSVFQVNRFLTRAASSAPLGGEYAEKLWGGGEQQKTQKVANIDQEEIEDPTLIADPDSCFCEFNGVQLHHKICEPELSISDAFRGSSSQSLAGTKRFYFPSILLHGFGASVFSWHRVMKPLAQVSGSKVLAFDRPAFGLTSRGNARHLPGNPDTKPINPYSMMFSTLATLHFIDFLDAEKAILVGHSAGALVAVDAYFEAPERVAALILVAPAILAPFSVQNSPKQSPGGRDNQTQGNSADLNGVQNPFLRLYNNISNFTRYVAEVIVRMAKGMADMISYLYKQALTAILRSPLCRAVIRMIIDKFGTAGVCSAWYDSNQVSDDILQGYTKPLKVKGWDKALVEYIVAMLTDSASKLKSPLSKRLTEISCPVLIITGDADRLVPSWNAEKLSQAIPGSHFELIRNCGHLPHEEKAEEFLSIVDKFLQKVFGAAEEPHLQVVT